MNGLGSAGSRLVGALGDKRVQGGLLFAGLTVGLAVIAYMRSNAPPSSESSSPPPSLQTTPSGAALGRELESRLEVSTRTEPSTTEIFASATNVDKSIGGKSGGVHFVTTRDYGTRVVKAVKNPIQIHYAHKLAQHFGVTAPKTSILNKDDLPTSFTDLSPLIKEAVETRENTDYIVDMEMVSGKTIDQFFRESELSPGETTGLLREFGKIALFDLAIINLDRFRLSDLEPSLNTGNIMITQQGEGAERTFSAVAIDQGFCEMPYCCNFEFILGCATRSLKKSKNDMAIAILNCLSSSVSDIFSSTNEDQVTAVIEGIEESLPKLQIFCDRLFRDPLSTLNAESATKEGEPVSKKILHSLGVPADDRDTFYEPIDPKDPKVPKVPKDMASLAAIDFKQLETYYTSILSHLES